MYSICLLVSQMTKAWSIVIGKWDNALFSAFKAEKIRIFDLCSHSFTCQKIYDIYIYNHSVFFHYHYSLFLRWHITLPILSNFKVAFLSTVLFPGSPDLDGEIPMPRPRCTGLESQSLRPHLRRSTSTEDRRRNGLRPTGDHGGSTWETMVTQHFFGMETTT